MKKEFFLIAMVLFLVSGSLSAQNVKEMRDVKGFTKVSFGVSGELYVNIGPEFKVELEGDRDILKDVVTEVSGGRLVIKKDSWRSGFNEKIVARVTMPEISGLGVSGSGKAEIKDPVKIADLGLSVSGSGKLYTTDLTVTKIDCSISGSGDIIIGGSGSASAADISISGSGNYTGEGLKIDVAKISISGSGNCSCNVSESLKASVSGSGNVTYLGSPKVDARMSGSGKIRSK